MAKPHVLVLFPQPHLPKIRIIGMHLEETGCRPTNQETMINNEVERAKWAYLVEQFKIFMAPKFKLITIRWTWKHKLQTKRSISISMQTDQFSVEFWLLCGEGKTLLVKVCVSDRGKIDFEFYLIRDY